MQMQLAIYDPTTNVMIADWSLRAISCHVKTGTHGYETCEAELRIPFYEAFVYYQQFGPLVLRVVWGSYKVWEGRLEDPTQFTATQSGLKITAFGAWVAFNDMRYIAVWSDTKLDAYFETVILGASIVDATQKFNISTSNNQIYITVVKGSSLLINEAGGYTYTNPVLSTRNILGISFDVDFTAPATLDFIIQSFDSANAFLANELVIIGTAARITRSYNLVINSAAITFTLALWNNTGGTTAPAGETGVNYVKLSNIRVVTSTTNRINTTLGTNIAAGTRTVTPGSIVGIFVGQRLIIDSGSATVSESVIVTAVSAGTFTAVFVFAHVIASTVTAFVVYPEEVIKDCVASVAALNSTQLSTDITLIQSQGVDQDQMVFEDVVPTDVINQMLAKSDNTALANQWVGLVYDNQKLITRARGSGTRWYVDVATLEIVRTLTNLFNSVYAVYKDVSNKRKLRTVINADSSSVTKFKITRRTSIEADTTNLVQANKVRDAVLSNQSDPIPRASITIHRVFDQYGTAYPLFLMRADDTITLRNLPPVLGQAYDKIRTLVVTHTDYDMFTGKMTLELEIPLPDQSIMLARALKG